MTKQLIITCECRRAMDDMEPDSVDAVVTDPPYELGFMGKSWDSTGIAYDIEVWRQCLRVLKPGGHLLAFGGTRTSHRMVCAIEDAGFQIRDSLVWLYGSGFPKSHNVSKAIDKAAGAKRAVIGVAVYGDGHTQNSAESIGYGGCDPESDSRQITEAATAAAKQWDGWGTALKPANEPIVLARKPFKGTVAANVLEHGTGALNIDACRVASAEPLVRPAVSKDGNAVFDHGLGAGVQVEPAGRWPANVVLDEEAGAMLDAQSGNRPGMSGGGKHRKDYGGGMFGGIDCTHTARNDSGGASRFFYCAKASRKERELGLDTPKGERRNRHPTVKPIALMRYLVRLVTPPGGLVLDPFAGSGTTGIACVLEGFNFVGIEMIDEYASIARRRLRVFHRSLASNEKEKRK